MTVWFNCTTSVRWWDRKVGHFGWPTLNFMDSVKDPVHVRDFHATVLQLLGYDHERFTYSHLGLEQKLTGVEPAKVISELLA